MKKVIKDSMKEMLVNMLMDFRHEDEMNMSTIEYYAGNYVNKVEKYLQAYNDFKED